MTSLLSALLIRTVFYIFFPAAKCQRSGFAALLLKVRRLVYNVSFSVCLLTGYVTLQEHAVIAVLSLRALAVLLQCTTFEDTAKKRKEKLSDNVTMRLPRRVNGNAL